jgi:hypothetical protein
MDLDAAMMPPDQPTSPLNVLQWNWGEAYERHEAPFNRAEVKGLRRCIVAAVQ